MTVWLGLAGVLLGAVAGSIGTFLTTRSSMRLELENAYDRALRDLRLEHYQQLFHISRIIPREWRVGEEPVRRDLLRSREQFHDWYFGEKASGLFLTANARAIYFRLQNELQTQGARHLEDPQAHLSSQESKALRDLASELRHQLAADVGTAEAPRVRWTRLGRTLPPPSESQVAG